MSGRTTRTVLITCGLVMLLGAGMASAQCLWKANGSNIFYKAGHVGIGTNSPFWPLEIYDLEFPAIRLTAPGIPEELIGELAVATNGGLFATFAERGDVVLRSLRGDLILAAQEEGAAIRFTTGNPVLIGEPQVQHMVLDGNGNLGIGTVDPTARLDVHGKTRTQILEITGGADFAEPFEVSSEQNVLPGMVLCIDPDRPGELRLSDTAYDRTVAGVVSGAGGVSPGLVMSQTGTKADGDHPVALSGRVWVMADASGGEIQPGDLLTTSAVHGQAMKASDHGRAQGAILGKAMTRLSEESGLVLALVSLQ